MNDALEILGFSRSDALVYEHLLRVGSDYPSRISAATTVNRTNVYEALDRLIAKGIVSFVLKNKMKWFEASAKSLTKLLAEQEQNIKTAREIILKEISTISPKQQLEASIFTGKHGLKQLFEEILEKQQPVSLIASELQLKKVLGPYFELWHAKRELLKIQQRTIFPVRFKKELPKRQFLEYKFTKNEFINPTTTVLCADTCVFIEWSTTPLAIKIENTNIIKSHQNHFDALWQALK